MLFSHAVLPPSFYSGRSRRNSLVLGLGTSSGMPPPLFVPQRGSSAALENSARGSSLLRRTSIDGGQVRDTISCYADIDVSLVSLQVKPNEPRYSTQAWHSDRGGIDTIGVSWPISCSVQSALLLHLHLINAHADSMSNHYRPLVLCQLCTDFTSDSDKKVGVES